RGSRGSARAATSRRCSRSARSAFRSASRATGATPRTRRCSSPPTKRASSPRPRSSSTAACPPAATDPGAMARPPTLGRYRVERVLGKGAMGVVYEAFDPKLSRKVAIKTIHISQLDEETAKDFSRRFVREAHAAARLNHPNIVQVYDFGEEGGVAYLVMEFIRGSELKSALASGRVFDRR